MTRTTLAQFWPVVPRPRPIHHCSKAIFEKRMDGGGFKAREALLPAKARRVGRGVCVQSPELFGPMRPSCPRSVQLFRPSQPRSNP
jgi:hypothetical protein